VNGIGGAYNSKEFIPSILKGVLMKHEKWSFLAGYPIENYES